MARSANDIDFVIKGFRDIELMNGYYHKDLDVMDEI